MRKDREQLEQRLKEIGSRPVLYSTRFARGRGLEYYLSELDQSILFDEGRIMGELEARIDVLAAMEARMEEGY